MIDINSIGIVSDEKFGKLKAPKSLLELMAIIMKVKDEKKSPKSWRGQSNIGWSIDSSAIRRLEKYKRSSTLDRRFHEHQIVEAFSMAEMEAKKLEKIDINSPELEDHLLDYENKLLNEARMSGYGSYHNRHLSDLEILASLQHFGAATRLLDFTHNVFVALWFACESQHLDSKGLLVGLDNVNAQPLKLQKYIDKPINKVLKKFPNKIITWEPNYLFERMRAQQSFFIFSQARNNLWGSVGCDSSDINSNGFILICITPELKKDMLYQWEVLFGYDKKSLFPGTEGFSKYHSSNSEFKWDFFN